MKGECQMLLDVNHQIDGQFLFPEDIRSMARFLVLEKLKVGQMFGLMTERPEVAAVEVTSSKA